MMTVPIPFTGSKAESKQNYRSHHWVMVDPEEPMRCMDCDAGSYMAAAKYPCGIQVPRKKVGNE